MTLYETLSIVIGVIALGLTIWAHRRITGINLKIQNILKISTSGGQSPIVSDNTFNIYNYNSPQ